MRLLKWIDQNQIGLTPDLDDTERPPYAILSHTWCRDNSQEVTFAEVVTAEGQQKTGYKKIRFCAEQARKDGISHCWVDTCCIDKTNLVELSEAITSMYRWYQLHLDTPTIRHIIDCDGSLACLPVGPCKVVESLTLADYLHSSQSQVLHPAPPLYGRPNTAFEVRSSVLLSQSAAGAIKNQAWIFHQQTEERPTVEVELEVHDEARTRTLSSYRSLLSTLPWG